VSCVITSASLFSVIPSSSLLAVIPSGSLLAVIPSEARDPELDPKESSSSTGSLVTPLLGITTEVSKL